MAGADAGVGDWQARNLAVDGYGLLADRALDPSYGSFVEIWFEGWSPAEGLVSVAINVSIRTARQETCVDVEWQDADGTERAEEVYARVGDTVRKTFTVEDLRIADAPPRSMQTGTSLSRLNFGRER